MKRNMISLLVLVVLCLSLTVGVCAASEPIAEEDLLVWDEAGLLSDAEVAKLNSKLQALSENYNAEIRVVTLSSMDGGDIDEFLEILYDEFGFGYGVNHDGVLLLVCMDPREY